MPERSGHSQSTTVAETYQCQDGYARIFVNQPEHWRRFVEWLGKPAELLDPKLENVQSRFALRPMIDRLVEARTLNYPVKKFFEEFQSNRLAAAPINPPSGYVYDEQTKHRNYFVEVDHPEFGQHRFPGDPYKFSESPWRIARGAPLLGASTDKIPDEFIGPSIWRAHRRSQVPATTANAAMRKPLEGIRVISFPDGHRRSGAGWAVGRTGR